MHLLNRLQQKKGINYYLLLLIVLSWLSVKGHATTLYLEQDCAAAGHTNATLSASTGDPINCFDSVMALNELSDFLWGASGINPTENNRALVHVGNGKFIGEGFSGSVISKGAINCEGLGDGTKGWTTFSGNGRLVSELSAVLEVINLPPQFPHPVRSLVLQSKGCTGLEFHNLTMSAPDGDGIIFENGGDSFYSNIEVVVGGSGWLEKFCGPDRGDGVDGEHYFYGSKIISKGITNENTYGYYGACARTWFYGSEVLRLVTPEQPMDALDAGIIVTNLGATVDGDIRLFGSTVRVEGAGNLLGVLVFGDGEFHMHGGIISMGSSTGGDITGLKNADFAHIVDTAWSFRTTGTVTRLIESSGSANTQAPFLWQPRNEPPYAVFNSLQGQDMYVEKDCIATGCSGGFIGQPHLMIYSESCTGAGGPWFNSTTSACRVP